MTRRELFRLFSVAVIPAVQKPLVLEKPPVNRIVCTEDLFPPRYARDLFVGARVVDLR